MTYRLPSLNSLRAFEAAGRHLGFKAAAAELGVTAGAISQQIKKLESSLGVALFRRLPHGLLLTPEGEVYLSKVSNIFEDLTEATQAIAPEINSKKFVVGICSKIRSLLPDNWPSGTDTLQHHIRECVETSDIEKIRTNEIDCLIRIASGPVGDLTQTIIRCKSGNQNMYFICKPGMIDCVQSKAILDSLISHC